ncbi:multidrug efflux system protein MdtL [Providencia rustigianii]|nr:multidrug efflux system protein MdtL [Providencia rustigianii]
MALTYVSLAPSVLMGDAQLSPLEFSIVFGVNGFWIMLASYFANYCIRKMGRPACLSIGSVMMALGCAGLLLGLTLLSPQTQTHWLVYMLPVACACTGLAFMMGTATSYALEPFGNEAGAASALVGFVQMAGRCCAWFMCDCIADGTETVTGFSDASRMYFWHYRQKNQHQTSHYY